MERTLKGDKWTQPRRRGNVVPQTVFTNSCESSESEYPCVCSKEVRVQSGILVVITGLGVAQDLLGSSGHASF